jgi:hypothetical protein
MTDEPENAANEEARDPRANFDYFSNEYAQALQAFKAIEHQAATLVALGGGDDLRAFIDQFIAMASGVKAVADERGEPHFADWFKELVDKATALRTAIAQR